jgi:hypothetical protein
MGYRDHDYPNPPNPSLNAEAGDLPERQFCLEQGHPLWRFNQLDSLYDLLDEDPLICLEYDRFLPGILHSRGH